MNYYDRNDGKMVYECDGDACLETSEFYGSFQECVKEAKEEGWRAYKVEDEWYHECPLCSQGSPPTEVFK